MKIYTKKGDKGMTGLIGGSRVSKASLRIECYGTVDELNSWMGVIRDGKLINIHQEQLTEIQDRLFTIGSSLACDDENSGMKIPDLLTEDVEKLEAWMDEMDAQLQPMRSFILPGGDQTSSFCHVARCVCRRAERICVDLSSTEFVAELVLIYLNRLSDYLFVLSRKIASDNGVIDHPWTPRI
ncbi:MAG: cob(I)yrinic acid a,c-diamide adenosyltransferase [Crocinitomicaceae bacterium]|nr:cob(I)yrinic acid a,c-diamide adenosyltransferase [Crocinitomicaceae bacterium]MCF8410549.1 cob(I)yrinic acid a,c-diamide adenosyltransferase [Crocinitomicaceae bacterium]